MKDIGTMAAALSIKHGKMCYCDTCRQSKPGSDPCDLKTE